MKHSNWSLLINSKWRAIIKARRDGLRVERDGAVDQRTIELPLGLLAIFHQFPAFSDRIRMV